MSALGLALLRLVVAVLLVSHGAHVVFDNAGLYPTGSLYTVLAAVELVGGLLIAVGFYTRVTAVLVITALFVGAWQAHLDWRVLFSSRIGLTFGPAEVLLLLTTALLCLILAGPGLLSVDGRRMTDAEARAAGRARLRGKM